MRFFARVVRGAGRGKTIGFPTINLDLSDAPAELEDGIYACRITINDVTHPGAMHIGPRPVFQDAPSCEVHVIDAVIGSVPERVGVELVAFVRKVRDFPDPAALVAQLRRDIDQIRAMLQDS